MNDSRPVLPEADQSRIEQWIHELDQFNATPGEGVTRQQLGYDPDSVVLPDSGTPAEEWNARLYLRREMEALGLQVEMDCMGDLLGTLPGSEPDLAPVWTGSHFDTVLHGGSFDGAAGVVTALEAVRRIIASGAPRKRNLTVVAYSAEEPARFGIGCIGSAPFPPSGPAAHGPFPGHRGFGFSPDPAAGRFPQLNIFPRFFRSSGEFC